MPKPTQTLNRSIFMIFFVPFVPFVHFVVHSFVVGPLVAVIGADSMNTSICWPT